MSNSEQPTMINYAMNFGVVVGLYYIVKFCLFPLSLRSTMAGLLFLGLTVVVPLLIFLLVKRYRDQYCGGKIGVVQAFSFSLLIMGFGALLSSVAHYVYFAYIDGGAMMAAVVQSVETLQGVDLGAMEGVSAGAIAQYNQYVDLMQQTVQQLQMLKPIDMTIGMLSNNVSWSVIISLPIALLVKNIVIKN